MGVSVTAALLVCVLARCAPAFGLTVEPSELDALGPVDSAEKNRADELSTAEPIDYGGNTEDTGPHTFRPPAKGTFDYEDEENGNEDEDTGDGEEVFGNNEADSGNEPPWPLEVDDEGEDIAYEGSTDLKKSSSDESRAFPVTGAANKNGSDVNVQSANKTGNGSRIPGYGIYGVRENVSDVDAIQNKTVTTGNEQKLGSARKNRSGMIFARDANGMRVKNVGNETRTTKNETETQGSVDKTGNKFGAKINGTGSKSRVSRQGKAPSPNGTEVWNGKTYVTVNRTKSTVNRSGDLNDLNENSSTSGMITGKGETIIESTGNAGETSEIKARVEEVLPNRTSKINKTELRNCQTSTSGECTESRKATGMTSTVSYAMVGDKNVRPAHQRVQTRKNKDESIQQTPNPGLQVESESNKRSYNYDETQVPSPSGDVREIITYDYGDIKEIIIPENPGAAPLPSAATLRYGLHPDTNSYNYNEQPYYNPKHNQGYPKHRPQTNLQSTIPPYNPSQTYPYFDPSQTPSYPSSTDYGHSPGLHPKPHLNYAPNSQNLNHDYSTPSSDPRVNSMHNPDFETSIPINSMSGDELKDHTPGSQYSPNFENYDPHYGSSPKPEFGNPGPGPPPSFGFPPRGDPHYNHQKAGPMYGFYGTPNSKTWVSYESIPIKNPSTDAGPPIVEIIYHRENGVVYEDDILDDVTTPYPESGSVMTSTPDYFPTPESYPSHGDEHYPSSHERPKNQKNVSSGELKSGSRPDDDDVRPRPGAPGGSRRRPSGNFQPGPKRPGAGVHSKKPGRPRLPSGRITFKDEDFPDDDDLPAAPERNELDEQSKKKKLDSRQRDSGVKAHNKSKNASKNKTITSGNDGFPKVSNFGAEDKDLPKKWKTPDHNFSVDDFQRGHHPQNDEFSKPQKNSDFPVLNEDFSQNTKDPDFNDEFSVTPKIADFDIDPDEFPDKNLDEAKKLVDGFPNKAKVAEVSEDHEWKQKKVTHSDTHDPTSERQKKKKTENSEKGEKHDSGHKKEEGKKGEKGTKSEHEFSEGKKLVKEEAKETAGASKKGGKKKVGKDEGGYYAEKHEGEAGEKAGEFEDEEKHMKGHSTKGKHEIHKKDEFSRKHSFFDEHHEGGKHEKHGGYEAAEEIEKGGEFHKGHKQEGHKSGHKGKKGKFKEGKHFFEDKGEDDAEGQIEKESHEEEYGSEGKKEKKEKKEFEL